MSGTNDTTLSVAALIVALVALLTTLGQLLQQYFATAEGYRRCQSSVVGPWARRTRLRWRWSEFRFETLFTTPNIALYRHPWPSPSIPHPPLKDRHWVIGSLDGDPSIDALISGSADESGDQVTWLRFLRATQWAHKKVLSRLRAGTGAPDEKTRAENSEKESQFLTIPLITFDERSWDFMPPDVVKPYARISVSDLAILARRLGMEWERFEPTDGILRAQGNGYMLTSTSVRSVGTMVQMSEMLGLGTQGPWMPWVSPIIPDGVDGKIPLIPSAPADKMLFGVLPAVGSDFLHRDFKFASIDDIRETLWWFTRDRAAVKLFNADYLNRMGWHPGVSDLLAIAAPMMYRPDIGVVGVPSPTLLPIFQGVTCHEAAFQEFHNQLSTLIVATDPRPNSPMRWVLERETYLSSLHPEWILGVDPIDREHVLLSAVHASYLQTTSFLTLPADGRDGSKSGLFRFLCTHHLRHLIRNFDAAYARAEAAAAPDPAPNAVAPPMSPPHPLKLAMAAYFICLPAMLDEMQSDASSKTAGIALATNSREDLMAGWVVLVFRAMCWNRCHYLVPGGTVPVRYCGSQLPVYIG